MKTKLLKKIRKRFSYYFNCDGDPVLVDHEYKTVSVLNLHNVREKAGYADDKKFADKVTIKHSEWLWRALKQEMLTPFGYKYTQIMYNQSVRMSKQKNKGRC